MSPAGVSAVPGAVPAARHMLCLPGAVDVTRLAPFAEAVYRLHQVDGVVGDGLPGPELGATGGTGTGPVQAPASPRRAAEARIIVTRRTLGDYQRETGHPGFGSGEVPGYGGVEAINVDACQ